ncbi:hypothetical protein ACFT2C_23120 [Promicromonospora sp. NPDC057138]|uniref:hypothetical protein n=1 Tax=Promicromonospora sp. NPDC057138 TaxID=3346031 RepID=UPI00363247FA
MRPRSELDGLAAELAKRVDAGARLDTSEMALGLRASGLSVVETCVVLAKGLGLTAVDAQELLVRLAASGADTYFVDRTDQFARDLAEKFPWFQDPLEPYLDESDAGFAYVFFAVEVTPEIVKSFIASEESGTNSDLDWRGVVAFLDEWHSRGLQDVDNVIKASFLLQFPPSGAPGYGLVRDLPAALHESFHIVRPHG